MNILGKQILLVAILLWASGFVVGAVVSIPLTMLYVYRKGRAFIAEREAKEGEE